VAKDYFNVGSKAPMVLAFSDWVEKGFGTIDAKGRSTSDLCSWRFWARGPKKGTLVCGVGRDSSDSVGRSYPLLIMGTGSLRGWENQWNLLPYACEKTWNQMEYISAKRFNGLKEFEDEIRTLRPPAPNWPEFVSERQDFEGLENDDLQKRISGVKKESEFIVSLDGEPSGDPQIMTCLWHYMLKYHGSVIPNAVFMGGAFDGTKLAVFKRALAPADFVRLWSQERV